MEVGSKVRYSVGGVKGTGIVQDVHPTRVGVAFGGQYKGRVFWVKAENLSPVKARKPRAKKVVVQEPVILDNGMLMD